MLMRQLFRHIQDILVSNFFLLLNLFLFLDVAILVIIILVLIICAICSMQVTVVGLVRSAKESSTALTYEIDDLSGPLLEVKQFVDNDVCSDFLLIYYNKFFGGFRNSCINSYLKDQLITIAYYVLYLFGSINTPNSYKSPSLYFKYFMHQLRDK